MGFMEVSYYYPNFISLFDHFSIGNRNINVAGSLHLELVHRVPSLGNVDLVVALHTVFSPFCFLAVLFRNHSFARNVWSISVNFRKEMQKMTVFPTLP